MLLLAACEGEDVPTTQRVETVPTLGMVEVTDGDRVIIEDDIWFDPGLGINLITKCDSDIMVYQHRSNGSGPRANKWPKCVKISGSGSLELHGTLDKKYKVTIVSLVPLY